ncbi:MAG: transposase [Planctomycetota bacterium]
MPRAKRVTPGGYVYHALNRGVGRVTIFNKPEDYQGFAQVLMETCDRKPEVELLCYCIMPNHWHLLLRPKRGGDLSEFMRLLTVTHTQRYHAQYHTEGTGPVYQGRFKSFPIQDDAHFLTAARYVERNALRAKLVERAEDWLWSSLHARRKGPEDVRLAEWPVQGGVPRQWLRTVNAALTQKELDAMRRCVKRGRPLGEERWVEQTAAKMGLSLRGPGRPRKDA